MLAKATSQFVDSYPLSAIKKPSQCKFQIDELELRARIATLSDLLRERALRNF